MTEETKFTEEEVKQIKNIQDNYAKIQSEFGQIGLSSVFFRIFIYEKLSVHKIEKFTHINRRN